MRTHSKDTQESITPDLAFQILIDGNDRFVNNLKAHRNLLEQVNETKEGQFPIATILSCIDSRTSAELIFDQGLGDIFSIRIAGNILNGHGLYQADAGGYAANALRHTGATFRIFPRYGRLGGQHTRSRCKRSGGRQRLRGLPRRYHAVPDGQGHVWQAGLQNHGGCAKGQGQKERVLPGRRGGSDAFPRRAGLVY